MKRLIILLLVVSATTSFGQHFKLTHATMRSWTSQSNLNQRGAEYRITVLVLKKLKNITIARTWVTDRCYTLESLTVNNKTISSSNQTITKGSILKIYLNVKEVKDESGAWILNNDECNGVIPPSPYPGKITLEYDVNGTSGTFSISDVEVLPPIQFN